MSKVLITGGLGFIGSALARQLLKNGDSVAVLDNAQRGLLSNIKDIKADVEVRLGDIRDERAVARACKGKETVYHLAAVNGTRYFYECPWQVLDINTVGTINIFKAVKPAGIKRLVFGSTSEAYQNPSKIPTPETEPVSIPDVKNPRFTYSASKIIGEMFCLHFFKKVDLHVGIVRYHNVYGPAMGHEHVIPQIVKKCLDLSRGGRVKKIRLPLQGGGDTTRAFCHIDDAVTATVLVAKKGANREVYNIGNAREEIKISRLAHQIAGEMGLKAHLSSEKLPAGSISRRCPDTRKIEKLGYEPKKTLKEGLRQTVAWYVDYYNSL